MITSTSDINIKIPKNHTVMIDLDNLDPEIIIIIRNGKKLTFPTWEFWQILDRIHDCEGYEFW